MNSIYKLFIGTLAFFTFPISLLIWIIYSVIKKHNPNKEYGFGSFVFNIFKVAFVIITIMFLITII